MSNQGGTNVSVAAISYFAPSSHGLVLITSKGVAGIWRRFKMSRNRAGTGLDGLIGLFPAAVPNGEMSRLTPPMANSRRFARAEALRSALWLNLTPKTQKLNVPRLKMPGRLRACLEKRHTGPLGPATPAGRRLLTAERRGEQGSR